jgi:hypothetical protein
MHLVSFGITNKFPQSSSLLNMHLMHLSVAMSLLGFINFSFGIPENPGLTSWSSRMHSYYIATVIRLFHWAAIFVVSLRHPQKSRLTS